jgi:hypothetical protein
MKKTLLLAAGLALFGAITPAQAQTPAKKPNILVVWGDDVGNQNISFNSRGAARPSRTPARSPRSAWRPSMKK